MLVALLQIGRLSAFMADSSQVWGSAVPDPLAVRHQCLSAYLHAADLSRRDDVVNLYDARWSPDGEDPYQYPPPFLLLPRAALALTDSPDAIRTVWFAVQLATFLIGAILLTRWIGGREGTTIALMVPIVLASVPTLLNFQFGQFHAMAVMLAIAAMIAFDASWTRTGGALLAVAILSKIFPAILLITLVARRRWRALIWTGIWMTTFCGAAVIVLGVAPFQAFVSYQLPRLASGEAFDFIERTSTPLFFIARNFSIAGIAPKLAALGWPGLAAATGPLLVWFYTALLVWLAWRTDLRAETRLQRAQTWLGLILLASLRSPLAPSAYVVVPALWLLALHAPDVRGRATLAIALTVAWLVLMGAPPLPATIDLAVGLASQTLVIALGLWEAR
jgi:hypothetical protein